MKAIDPVCGMEVDVLRSPWKISLREDSFYFCSPACMRTFEENAKMVLDLKTLRRVDPTNLGVAHPTIIADNNHRSNHISPGGKTMLDESGCHVEPVSKTTSPGEASNLSTIRLAISGMGCPNCATRVQNSLLMLSGVVEANVDHISGEGIVRYNNELVNPHQLTWAVAAAGGDGRHEYAAHYQ